MRRIPGPLRSALIYQLVKSARAVEPSSFLKRPTSRCAPKVEKIMSSLPLPDSEEALRALWGEAGRREKLGA